LNVESLCLLGLLRSPDQLESSLKLLADSDREEAEKTLSPAKQLAKPELVQRWAKLRENEWSALSKEAADRMGLQLDAVAPAFRLWLASWLVDQHG
jgi:hypothetical protein